MSGFRPSGTMCAACQRKYKDCDFMLFDQMPVMRQDKDGTKVVRCVWFKRAKPTHPTNTKEAGNA